MIVRILRKLKCKVLGHAYRVHQVFTPYSRRVVCDCCKGDWAMNDNVRCIVQWSGEFEQMYALLGYHVRPVPRIGA